jgi:hypothetical protein
MLTALALAIAAAPSASAKCQLLKLADLPVTLGGG